MFDWVVFGVEQLERIVKAMAIVIRNIEPLSIPPLARSIAASGVIARWANSIGVRQVFIDAPVELFCSKCVLGSGQEDRSNRSYRSNCQSLTSTR